MSILTTWRRFITAFAFAFFALQSAALAHGYSYGDDPHEHNGQVCDVALVAEEADTLPAVPVIFTRSVQIFTPPAFLPAVKSAPPAVYAPRPPPKRGPPAASL